MDFYQKVAVPGGQAKAGCQSETAPSAAVEFLPGKQEGADGMSLEWLSTFMEDCLSAAPSYTLTPQPHPPPATITNISSSSNININSNNNNKQTPTPSQMQPLDKSKDKKRQAIKEIHDLILSDPPLLQQTHWLADSELVFPKASHVDKNVSPTFHAGGGGREEKIVVKDGNQQPRRCTHCLTQKTPQWRAGPEGPKTLCNACGMRFKSGSLFPEYRPAKSPTFVSFKHSNSTKKIMKMRKGLLLSPFK